MNKKYLKDEILKLRSGLNRGDEWASGYNSACTDILALLNKKQKG